MARSRREKTLIDYIVIAISPALIIALVGSLTFFLLDLVYRGQSDGTMQWVLSLFVFAAVLVARIGIEQGDDHGKIYTAVLLVATAIVVMKFVNAFLIGWGLLLVIVWCSSRLVTNCTLVDDSDDSSGVGLLEAAGIRDGGSEPPHDVRSANVDRDNSRPTPEPEGKPEPSEPMQPAKRPPPDPMAGVRAPVPTVLASGRGLAEASLEREEKLKKIPQRDRKPNRAPGISIIYFSLAALPLFGLGQLLIPVNDVERRQHAFGFLACYVFSALGLLLTTSFLGLRRYLRQRRVTMSSDVARGWLTWGAGIAVLVLLIAVLIPRPQGDYSINDFVDRLNKTVDASQISFLNNETGQGQGNPKGDVDPNAEAGKAQQPQHEQARQPGGDDPGSAKQGAANSSDKNSANDEKNSKKSDTNKSDRESNSAEKESSERDNKNASDSESQQGESQNNTSAPQKDQSRKDRTSSGSSGEKPREKTSSGHENKQQEKQDTGKGKSNQGSQKQQDKAKGSNDAKKNEGTKNDGSAPGGGAPASSPTTPSFNFSSIIQMAGGLIKLIYYVILVLVGIYCLWRYGGAFLRFLKRLWETLMGLFAPRESKKTASTTEEEKQPVASFSSFANPFTNGMASRMKLPQLLDYTFRALEALGRDIRAPRLEEQTPLEFGDQLARILPKVGKDVLKVIQLYVLVAYARKNPGATALEDLERLWRGLAHVG